MRTTPTPRTLLLVPVVGAAIIFQGNAALRAHVNASHMTTNSPSRPFASSSSGPAFRPNVLQIASLRWYPVIRQGPVVLTGNRPLGLAFNGSEILEVDQGEDLFRVRDPGTGLTESSLSLDSGAKDCTDPSYVVAVGLISWISCYGAGEVIELSQAGDLKQPVNVGANPAGMAYDGTSLWVANNGDHTVSKINPDTPSVSATITVGTHPNDVAFDGAGHVWVTNRGSNTVSEVSTSSNQVIGTVKVGQQPYDLAFDGQHMWISNTGGSTVTEISVATRKVVRTVTVGKGPSGVVYDGQHIWSANYYANTASEIDAGSGKVIATVKTGPEPSGMAFDGTNIWVSNYGDQTLQQL